MWLESQLISVCHQHSKMEVIESSIWECLEHIMKEQMRRPVQIPYSDTVVEWPIWDDYVILKMVFQRFGYTFFGLFVA